MRRIFSLNIGTIIFGLIFIYIVFSVLMYITAVHVKSYRVVSGSLAKNQVYTGCALLSEKVVSADANGYISYYAKDGAKVSAGGVIYGISADKVQQMPVTLEADTLAALQDDMETFAAGFDPLQFHDVYSLRYQAEGRVLNQSLNSLAGITGAMTLGNSTIYTSGEDGIICYSSDGGEELDLRSVTAETFDEKKYRMRSLKLDGPVHAGDPVYRVITSEEWSVLIPLTSRQKVRLTDTDRIRVRFLKDGVSQNASLHIHELSDGSACGKLDFSSGLIRYLGSRFIELELVTNTAVGLKIPVTSIVTRRFYTIPDTYAVTRDNETGFLLLGADENGDMKTVFTPAVYYDQRDGLIYVDSSVFKGGDIIVREDSMTDRYIVREMAEMNGVYSMNKGYAQFRRVQIMDRNEDYCIVEKGTPYGIAEFDNIVENASGVKESQITAR